MLSKSNSIPLVLQAYLGEPDPRTRDWPMINSFRNLILLCLGYFLLVYAGPKVMKKRKAFNLRYSLIAFNLFQILFSAYICKEIFWTAYLSGYEFPCAGMDESYGPEAMRMTRAFWLFYISKVIDVVDTVFLVLRKKESQLTFLHIYHHAAMLLNWYLCALYMPGGQAFFSVGINAFVHVVMYNYYFLSSLHVDHEKYLWWKKYLTQLQLIQFVLMILHIGIGYITGCTHPAWLIWYTVTYICTLIVLFAQFYILAYQKKKKLNLLSKQRFDTKAAGDNMKWM